MPPGAPSQPGALIGRASDLDTLRATLLRADVRLVTLIGPPGVGKTRLSIQLASELREWLDDRVHLVALADIATPERIIPAVAAALGVRETPGQPLRDRLADRLRDGARLLVLDNFKHLADGAAIVGELLDAAPQLTVLVTSRVALRLPGEREYAVQPLARPALDARLPLGMLARFPAVELFVQRARAARPEFTLTDANVAAVVAICHALHGLPLAIELAAARARLLSPASIHERLARHQQLQVLAGGAAGGPPRQQTIEGAIDWSYDMLAPHERRLFRQISVFAGGATVAAVEAVCGGAKGLFAWITALLDHSLLQHDTSAADEPRLAQLEVIRAHARARLEEAGEADALRRQHAAYYLALAEEAAPELTRAQQVEWMERLDREQHNLRAALRWALDSADAATAGRMAVALWRYWFTRGQISEGRSWFDQLISSGASLAPTLEIRVLDSAAKLAHEQSDFASAAALHEQVLAMQRERDDRAGIGGSLNSLGWIARLQGDYDRALALCGESLEIYRALGDRQNMSYALNNLGLAAGDKGDYERATELHQASLALKWELEDKVGIASSLNNLGLVARLRGDFARAREQYEEGLALCRAAGNRPGIAIFLNNLGSLACSTKEYERASILCDESLALRRELGDRRGMASSLDNLATAALGLGDLRRATVLAKESLALFWEVGARHDVARGLTSLAMLADTAGHPLRAARLYGAADAIERGLGVSRAPYQRDEYERGVAAARAQVEPAAWAAAWAAGASAQLNELIAGALAE